MVLLHSPHPLRDPKSMKLLSIKAVPTVSWSSERPLNFRPRLFTLSVLCLGLVLFGLGDALLVAAGAGVMAFFTDWRATVTVGPSGAGIVGRF